MKSMRTKILISLFISLLTLLVVVTAGIADLNVIGTLHDDRTVLPGKRYEGIIVLRNQDDQPQAVNIEQFDYSSKSDGSNDYGIPGSNKRSNAGWISLPVNKLIIPPKSDISLRYLVQVPNDTRLKGTYWSMIMLTPEDPKTEMETRENSVGIKTIIRYGYQATSQITDTGNVSVQFLSKDLVTSEGKTILRIGLKNDGARLITPAVWAEIFDSTGTNLGKFETIKQRLFPGSSISSDIDISKVPAGQYKALVIVDTGLTDPLGAQYDLVVKK